MITKEHFRKARGLVVQYFDIWAEHFIPSLCMAIVNGAVAVAILSGSPEADMLLPSLAITIFIIVIAPVEILLIRSAYKRVSSAILFAYNKYVPNDAEDYNARRYNRSLEKLKEKPKLDAFDGDPYKIVEEAIPKSKK